MKKTTFTIIWLGLSLSLLSAQSDTISLRQMLSIADGQSVEIKAANMRVEQSRLDYQLHRAGQRFQLSLNANVPNYFNTSRSVVQPDGSVIFTDISQNTTQAGLRLSKSIMSTNTELTLESNALRFDDFSFDQLSYNGVPLRLGIRQGIHTYNQAKWNEKILPLAAKTQELQSKDEIFEQHLQIVASYFDVLRAEVEREIASSNKSNSEKILSIAEERYKLGKISESELTMVQLNAASSQKNLIEAKRMYELSMNVLKDNANYYESLSLKVPDALPILNVADEHLLIQKAWERNSRYQSLMLDQLIIDSNKSRIKRDYGFRGELLASLGLVKSGNGLEDIYKNPKQEVLVNMSFTLPIFDGSQKKIVLQKQSISEDLLQDRKTYAEQAFKNQLRVVIHQMEARAEELKQSKEIFTLAKKGYTIANDRYLLGDMTVTELTLAYEVRDQAWRNYIRTISDYWVTYYQLRALTGYDFEKNKFINIDK